MTLQTMPSWERIALLSTQERDRAARFRFDTDRRRYVATHVQVRERLAAVLAVSAGAIRFGSEPHGKPCLDPPCGWSFNLSHSGDAAALALVRDASIGLDVEVLRRIDDLDDLANRCFTTAERRELALCPAEHRDVLFLQGWTRKEACLKAIGSGLLVEPNTFEAGLSAEDAVPLVAWNGQAHRLRLRSFSKPGLVGAVAVALQQDEPVRAC